MTSVAVVPEWGVGVVSRLASRPPESVEQLAERVGVPRGDLLPFLREHPHLLEIGTGWVNALNLADGVALLHVLSAAEQRSDVLAADDDLALWGVLAQDGLPLGGGGEVRARPLPQLPAEAHTSATPGHGLIGQGLVGPRGWLAGFQVGDLLQMQLRDGVLHLRVAEAPQSPTDHVEALVATFAAALTHAVKRYRDGDGDAPTADICAVLADLLAAEPGVFAEPLPPLGALLASAGWETFGGRMGFAGTPWNLAPIRKMSRPDAVTAMLAMATLLTWSDAHPNNEQQIELLREALRAPEILSYLADEVERRVATAGGSFTEVLDRLAAIADSPADLAAAALLSARAAEGSGDSIAAQRLVHQALAHQADLRPALLDAAEYAACRGELREADRHLRRVDHPVADALHSAVRSVLGKPAGGDQPGRNQPCSCGSGRKFKACCQASAVAPLAARSGLLYTMVATFAQRAWSADRFGLLINQRAGNLESALLCVDLLLTHYGAAERFLRTRGAWLRDDERRLIETWAGIPIGAFEVRDIRPGAGVTIRMLPSREVVVLRDRKFSTSARRLDLLCGRLLSDGSRPQLLAMPARVPRDRRRDLLDVLAHQPTGQHIAQFFGPQPDPHLQNSDGHDYLDGEVTLHVPDDADGAWQRLSTRLVRIDSRALEHHEERRGKVVSLGKITRVGQQWTLRANSRERLAVLESLVRAEAEAVREIGRRSERLGGEPPDDGRIAQTLVLDNYVVPTGSGSAKQTLLRTNCESWVDTPNTMGMTPREAIKAGGDALIELQAIIDDMQWYNDRNRDRGEPSTMDIAWIRAELGLPA